MVGNGLDKFPVVIDPAALADRFRPLGDFVELCDQVFRKRSLFISGGIFHHGHFGIDRLEKLRSGGDLVLILFDHLSEGNDLLFGERLTGIALFLEGVEELAVVIDPAAAFFGFRPLQIAHGFKDLGQTGLVGSGGFRFDPFCLAVVADLFGGEALFIGIGEVFGKTVACGEVPQFRDVIFVLERQRQERFPLTAGDQPVLRVLVFDTGKELAVIERPFSGGAFGDFPVLDLVDERDEGIGFQRFGSARTLGGIQPQGELVVEGADHFGPLDFPLTDFVQLIFHHGGEADLEQFGQTFHQIIVDPETQIRGDQFAFFLLNVLADLNGVDDGRVGGRTADAVDFQFLDERGFGEAGSRFRELLFRNGTEHVAGIVLLQSGEHGGIAGIVIFILHGAFFLNVVGAQVTVELDHGGGAAEGVFAAGDFHGGAFQIRRCHLAGNKSAPDERVETELLGIQEVPQFFRREVDIRGADRFVGFLSVAFGLIHIERGGHIFTAVFGGDEGAAAVLRFRRNRHGVRSHVSDETDGAGTHIHAFVQLLGDPHGLAGGEAEGAAGCLLERTGDKGRISKFSAGSRSHIRNMPRGDRLDFPEQFVCIGLVVDFKLFAVDLCQFGAEGVFVGIRIEFRHKVPVFFRDEGEDLPFPFADETERHTLHAAGGNTPFDTGPEQGADLITHDPVQHAACLLGVHQRHVDVARILKRLFNGGLGDLVECHPAERCFPVDLAQHFFQVPRNGFPFAVRVGRQIDLVGGFCRGFQFGKVLAAPFVFFILGLKIVFNIHAERPFGQVTHVSHGRLDHVVRAEDLTDGFDFGR